MKNRSTRLGWFITVCCLLRGLHGQPISCSMSFVYGFRCNPVKETRRMWAFFGVFLWPLGSDATAKNYKPRFFTETLNLISPFYICHSCCEILTYFFSQQVIATLEIMWWTWALRTVTFPHTPLVIDCMKQTSCHICNWLFSWKQSDTAPIWKGSKRLVAGCSYVSDNQQENGLPLPGW